MKNIQQKLALAATYGHPNQKGLSTVLGGQSSTGGSHSTQQENHAVCARLYKCSHWESVNFGVPNQREKKQFLYRAKLSILS